MRERLIKELAEKGITDEKVLEAMGKVPRHGFVQSAFSDDAYEDKALPIDAGQTISQPYTVAFQTQLLQVKKGMKVLEIGTGSGYQGAVLVEMGAKLFTIELERKLHNQARERFEDLDYNLRMLCGDGSKGWPKYQTYDRIIVTAASPSIPEPLKTQLSIGGRLIIPMGDLDTQEMCVVIRKAYKEFEIQKYNRFKFVPLRGMYGFR